MKIVLKIRAGLHFLSLAAVISTALAPTVPLRAATPPNASAASPANRPTMTVTTRTNTSTTILSSGRPAGSSSIQAKSSSTGAPAATASVARPAGKPTRYQPLQLRNISGPPGARQAIINNQTLRSNDVAQVQVGAQSIQVECLAVHERSVVIRATGEPGPRELKLFNTMPAPLPPLKSNTTVTTKSASVQPPSRPRGRN